MILHRAYISPHQRPKFKPTSSSQCLKCKTDTGTLTHCFWSCIKVKQFWQIIAVEMNKILSIKLSKILFITWNNWPNYYWQIKKKDLHNVKFWARKCLLLNWITEKNSIQNTVTQSYPELCFCWLSDIPAVFVKTWQPFLSYIGLNMSLQEPLYCNIDSEYRQSFLVTCMHLTPDWVSWVWLCLWAKWTLNICLFVFFLLSV